MADRTQIVTLGLEFTSVRDLDWSVATVNQIAYQIASTQLISLLLF